MGTTYNTDGSIAEKIPQDVGVARAVAEGIGNCKEVPAVAFIPQPPNDCALSSGVSDRAECFRSNGDIANSNTIREMSYNNKTQPPSCTADVTAFGKSYMEKEAIQAKEISGGSKVVAGIAGAAVMTKELVTGFVAGTAAGDTRIGSVNVSGSSDGGAAGEGTGGRGTTTMDTNIGAGNSINTLSDGAQINRAEKQVLAPVTGGGDSAPVLDDSGDGSGNQAGINPFGQ